MDGRWNYDHEYFQRMIDRHDRMIAEAVGCIITDMSELNKDDPSSDGSSMPGLQDRGQSDLSSGDDTDSYGEDDMYDDGECWGYKEQTLKQIISGTSDGISLAIDTPTLYALSLHGHAKVLTADIPGSFLHFDLPVDTKAKVNSTLNNGARDFCQAKERIRFPTGLTTTKIKLWRTRSHRSSGCMMQDHSIRSDPTWNIYLP